MTTTDTMDTISTVQQSIRCIEAGAELIRITAPSKKEAENLLNIKNELRKRGFKTPLVADIHFTPNAAEIAARIVEKVRVNPGNYVDKKKFEQIEYSDVEYNDELDRIRQRFTPLIRICKQYGTAMRIGTNHGSLSDRIMSRFGDTPIGMVESALEFLRIAESENYYNIVLSMKSSNPLVVVKAYRLLIEKMQSELGCCYPLHLGVTEAGDGEDGRIKSAIGIGALLEEGIGDTIRVSLTEDPEYELPVCKKIIKRYQEKDLINNFPSRNNSIAKLIGLNAYHPPRKSHSIHNIGNPHIPVVIADLRGIKEIKFSDLLHIGYTYDPIIDKWQISDSAADYILTNSFLEFELPGTLGVIMDYENWIKSYDKVKYFPLINSDKYFVDGIQRSTIMNFILIDLSIEQSLNKILAKIKSDHTAVICLISNGESVLINKKLFNILIENNITNPLVIFCNSFYSTNEEDLIHYAIETGSLLIEGNGNGICLSKENHEDLKITNIKILNSIAFGILQATRTRISKTEYISCPSCGRTLFDLQETTAKIRAVTNHLKGVKIAIMGCIVNGPGEMADADFGYVGSGPGKITLYKGKEIVKRSIPEETAVLELITLIKENDAWKEPALINSH